MTGYGHHNAGGPERGPVADYMVRTAKLDEFENILRIMAFLRRLRLEHARSDLLAVDPAFMTVTDIAIECGFSHTGESAALYKRTHGGTPIKTLLRA